MKNLFVFSALFFLPVFASAQNKGEVDSALLSQTGTAHYLQEYDLDKPADTIAWLKHQPGMHAAFANIE